MKNFFVKILNSFDVFANPKVA